MYYKLKDNYLLRGWQKLPWALVNINDGKTAFLTRKFFEVLQLADGEHDFSHPLIDENQRKLAESLVKEGYLVKSENPSPIEEEQRYSCFPNRYMAAIQWSITGKCNYRCKHCFLSAPDVHSSELSYEEIKQVIEQMAAAGIFNVMLTGGEPLVRSDFLDIVDELKAHHIHISQIYTNGALVNEKLLEALSDRGMKPEFWFSFDGIGHHDWLRGIPGAQKAVEKAFSLCKERGFPTYAEYCLHRGNKDVIMDSIEMLADLGCKGLKIAPVEDLGEWQKGNYNLDLSFPETMEIYLKTMDEFLEKKPSINLQLAEVVYLNAKKFEHPTIPAYTQAKDPSRLNLCDAIRKVMYISAEGDVLPCISLAGTAAEKEFENVFETPLSSILDESNYLNFITMKVSDYFEQNRECNACVHKLNCLGGCRAKAMINEGSLLARDTSSCRLYKEGWIKKIQQKLQQFA